MKRLTFACLTTLLFCACRKDAVTSNEARQSISLTAAGKPGGGIPVVTWETVYDGTSFNSYAAMEADWNYLYPWGSDHNGSARMYASSTDHSQVYIETPGVLTIRSTKVPPTEGKSSHDPWLTIQYHSGAIHGRQQVTINDTFPSWDISGDFRAPITVGTWPAFWITGAYSWPPESDILEYKGSNVNWQNTAEGPDWTNVSWETTKTTVPDALTNWHSYRVVMNRIQNRNGSWSNNVRCQYYIDGVLKGTHTGNNFFNQTFNIIVNLQMEGSSGSPAPTTDTYYYAKNIVVKRGRAVGF
jgi:hypothetical protein